ncbi:hypothetical protein Daura_17970 [Dactylosporangium aurantiacum]|uniref:Uncharacterized protein n=1 Tax=Dactylosporangium aurantiacum TaxID=35754 RepID=A0A9Q9IKL1_9ACTN|nr:hypothetical protein [Dactylosporangium aurantiacum]MDG6105944.1 hypothetical protein [Dactylosporangium aurantiacum]UWZ57887.1 hypothetical protein Daura_17970 [Dactylosporangium aurantiacum]
MTVTSGHVRGVVRCLYAAPALLAGVLGCLGAQGLTGRLLAHTHGAAHGMAAGVPHVHDRLAASALLAGCLVTVSLAAALAAAGRRAATRAAVMWASGLSIIAFVVIDRLSHGTGDALRPSSPLLVLTGTAVHVCVGAGVGLLWWRWLDGVRPPVSAGPPDPPAVARPARRPRRAERLRRPWWVSPIAGRAPPCRTV